MVQKKTIFETLDRWIHGALFILLALIPYAHGGMTPEIKYFTQAFIFGAWAWFFFRDDTLKAPPVFWLFFLVVILSFLLSPQKLAGARALYSYLTPVFLCLLFSRFLSQSESQSQFTLILIITNAVILSLSAFFMHLGMLPDFFHGDTITVHGFYANKNHLSGYVEMAALLCWGQVLGRKGLTVRLSFALLLLFFMLFIFLIGSRSGALSLGLAILIVILFNFYPRFLSRRNLVFWLTAMAVIFSIFFYQGQRCSQELSPSVREKGGESSWQDRASLNRSSFEMLQDHWILGIGVGQYELNYPQYREAGMNRRIDYAHNDVLQFVVETGVGGILVLCMGLFCFFRWASRDSSSRAAILGAVGALTALFIHSFFDFNLQIPANAYTAGVILAVLYSSFLKKIPNELGGVIC